MSASIPPRTGVAPGPWPLSFAQERLWFLDRFQPDTAVYNVARGIRLSGNLDVNALGQALDSIVARHAVLRTVFREVDGRPVQTVSEAAHASLEILDIAPDDLQRAMDREARRAFHLERDPMMRGLLFRLAPGEHVLLLVMHHIASDGWSLGILLQELRELYTAFHAGRQAALPPLPVSYADFALWQRESLSGPALEEHLAYWRDRLAGSPALLEVPCDRPRPPAQSYRGGREFTVLPADLSASLRALSRQHRASLFVTLLAAFQVLLHRYTGATDIPVGSPIANRMRVETEGLIGFFVNTLVLRGDLSGDPAFSELLRRVQVVALEAYDHQDMPFEKLVEALQPQRTLRHPPLFQHAFALQNAEPEAFVLPGLSASLLEAETGTSMFDLTLSIDDDGGPLRGWIEYNSDIFDAPTVRRMLGHYGKLLEAAVADPDCPISRLELLTAAERRQFADWNGTRRDYPRACVHTLFEAQARRSPDAVAAICRGASLTYAGMNERANRLARYLRQVGAGPHTRVGVCLGRSLDMLVAFLAILKSGAAYVPLDTENPRARLGLMIEDAGIQVLLTDRALVPRLPAHRARVVFPDAADEAEDGNLDLQVSSGDPAYIMYTSGSTGTPKGVEVAHHGIVRLLFGVDYARFGPSEVFLQLAPVSFDASTLEIWGPLLHGGLCVLAPERAPSPLELGELISQHKITTLWLTASLFNTIVDEAPETLAPLRQLLSGGEALSPPHVRRALEALPATDLINGYGPTESTTFACCYRIPRGFDAPSVPIGRPIGNTRAHVVDRNLQMVPVGVPGELLIGGDGLARGYLNHSELTREKFIADPFASDPGERLYRTGDLVRYLPDGNLEFLSRLDEQVKIRGFRVELGEIEAALAAHPGIKAAAVVAREDTPGDRRLVAYLVPRGARQLAEGEFCEFLREKLPDYMVPARFVTLAALPVGRTGKVDRHALPAPGAPAPAHQSSRAPRDDIEARVAAIWKEVLGLDAVAPDADFFECGGHSLLAVKTIARLEREFGIRLLVSTLFRASTVEQLAEIIRQRKSAPPAVHGEDGTLPFLFLGDTAMLRPLALLLPPDRPFVSVSFPPLDAAITLRPYSVRRIAAALVQSVRAAQPRGPYFIGGWCLEAFYAYEVARQLSAAGDQVALLALLDSVSPTFGRDLRGVSGRIRFLARKARIHSERLREAGFRGAAVYVRQELTELANKLRRAAWKGSYSTGLAGDSHTLEAILYLAALEYRPETYPGRIALFRSAELARLCGDSELGWGDLAGGRIDVYEVPGRHRTMFMEPYVQTLADELRHCLEQAHSPRATPALSGPAPALPGII